MKYLQGTGIEKDSDDILAEIVRAQQAACVTDTETAEKLGNYLAEWCNNEGIAIRGSTPEQLKGMFEEMAEFSDFKDSELAEKFIDENGEAAVAAILAHLGENGPDYKEIVQSGLLNGKTGQQTTLTEKDIETAAQLGEELVKWCENEGMKIGESTPEQLMLMFYEMKNFTDFEDFDTAREFIAKTGETGVEAILSQLGDYRAPIETTEEVQEDTPQYTDEEIDKFKSLITQACNDNGFTIGINNGKVSFISETTGKATEATADFISMMIDPSNTDAVGLYTFLGDYGDAGALQLVSQKGDEISAEQAEYKRLTGNNYEIDGNQTLEDYLTNIKAENQRIIEENLKISKEGQKYSEIIMQWSENNNMTVEHQRKRSVLG